MAVLEDCSPGLSKAAFSEWARGLNIEHPVHFDFNDGMTRSWNHGLQIAKGCGYDLAICGNADTIFSPGFDVGLLTSLQDAHLVGPVTNAAGWGTPRQRLDHWYDGPEPTDDPERIEHIAWALADKWSSPLQKMRVGLSDHGLTANIPEFLNGFTMIARTSDWWSGSYDSNHVFNPANKMTENEVELQFRWHTRGRRFAVAGSSFVFHYRSVIRGEASFCEGTFRPGVGRVK